MRAKFIGIVMLGLLLPALLWAAPAQPAAAAAPVSAPEELAGDTADDSATPAVPAAPSTLPGKTPAEPVAGPISPEQYYQLLLERQQLSLDYYREVNKALDAHAKDPKAALKAVAALEAERNKRTEALFDKYRISSSDYYISWVGTPALAQRSKYLDEHPEVRDRIAANSSELKALEKQVSDRVLQLVNRPAPPPPRKPKKG